MRINKWLVERGVAPARRKADELIIAGRVSIDGVQAKLGDQVRESSTVLLDGIEIVGGTRTRRLIAYHKPVGEICSHAHQGQSRTIFDTLPEEYAGFKIIGRLDKDSQGLILLTNDGSLAQQYTHPSKIKAKRYEVTLSRQLTTAELQRLKRGVDVAGALWRLPEVTHRQTNDYIVVLHEGKNRQIRRCFASLGIEVLELKRTHIAEYSLKDLKPGVWREERINV